MTNQHAANPPLDLARRGFLGQMSTGLAGVALSRLFAHELAAAPTDRGLARTLATLDLRAAEAALLARDTASFRAAVQRARTQLQATFDATATAEVVAALDRLGASEAPPAPTVLGAALKELRNLRSTHRLRQQGRGDAAAGAGAP